VYYRPPSFLVTLNSRQLVEYMVLDIEPRTGGGGGSNNNSGSKYLLAEATVARSSDLWRNDIVYHTITHLGNVLRPGEPQVLYLLSAFAPGNARVRA
jgi:nonsense-mediated mRNA decay protein 3